MTLRHWWNDHAPDDPLAKLSDGSGAINLDTFV